MKRIILLLIGYNIFVHGQTILPNEITFSAGVAMPSYPDVFYDYWKDGLSMNFKGFYNSESRYHSIFSIDYNRFSFDKDRFFQYTKYNDQTTTIEGGGTTLISVSYGIQYTLDEWKSIRPSIYGMLGGMFSLKNSSTVSYLFVTKESKSDVNVFFVAPVGINLQYPLSQSTHLSLDYEKSLTIKKNRTVNSEFNAVRLGFEIRLPSKGLK